MSLMDALTGHVIRLSLTGSFEVRFAGDGPASFDDYEDLAGPDIGAILGKVGWRYGGAVTRVDAFPAAGPAQLPAASAWATPIVTPAGARGINISYGVGCAHRGNGLSALLSLVAVGECRAVQTSAFGRRRHSSTCRHAPPTCTRRASPGHWESNRTRRQLSRCGSPAEEV